jgi:hypothetical protein
MGLIAYIRRAKDDHDDQKITDNNSLGSSQPANLCGDDGSKHGIDDVALQNTSRHSGDQPAPDGNDIPGTGKVWESQVNKPEDYPKNHLREFWYKLNPDKHSLPFEELSQEEKTDLINTLGFEQYQASLILQKFCNDIVTALSQTISEDTIKAYTDSFKRQNDNH